MSEQNKIINSAKLMGMFFLVLPQPWFMFMVTRVPLTVGSIRSSFFFVSHLIIYKNLQEECQEKIEVFVLSFTVYGFG